MTDQSVETLTNTRRLTLAAKEKAATLLTTDQCRSRLGELVRQHRATKTRLDQARAKRLPRQRLRSQEELRIERSMLVIQIHAEAVQDRMDELKAN